MQRPNKQESFMDGWLEVRASFLDEVDRRVDWKGLTGSLQGIYGSETGRPSYPLDVLLKCLLLQQWYGLSDPQMEAAVADRLSWRRFVGLGVLDSVPDHSTLSRFRSAIADRQEELWRAVQSQLQAQGLLLKRGTMIDATLVQAASKNEAVDNEARTGRGSKGFVHGYKAHMAVDQDSELIRDVIVTPGNVNETVVADDLVQGDEGTVYADAAYSTHKRRVALQARGIRAAIVWRCSKHDRFVCPVLRAYNRMVSRTRARVETVFAVLKQHMGWRRCRYIGLRRNTAHVYLLALAYNLKRASRLQPVIV
jgi:transposase, IS5 family